jgi:hypothetical protein
MNSEDPMGTPRQTTPYLTAGSEGEIIFSGGRYLS